MLASQLSRLAEKMQRELEVLRFESATKAGTREREKQRCCICFDFDHVHAGLVCETIGADCAPREVQRILDTIQEAEPLARHRAQGAASCVRCRIVMHRTPSQRLPGALFQEFRAAQDTMVEQRLFEELQQRIQEQLEAARREFENTNNVTGAEQGEAAASEFIVDSSVGRPVTGSETPASPGWSVETQLNVQKPEALTVSD